MTQDLYRKEALENRNRSLYGEITLRTSPSNLVITLLLVILTIIIFAALFLLEIPTNGDNLPLLDWVKRSLFRG